MTDILIIHNPFLTESQFVVDGIAISATSGLYKYIKTPMQDWVGNFIPALVEHCNDDELNITFRGLQHNYDDLEAEVASFLKKNSDYEIELSFDVCKSHVERIKEVNELLAEMKSQDRIPELYEAVIKDMQDDENLDWLQLVAFSANGSPCAELVNDLLQVNVLEHKTSNNYCYTNHISDTECEKENIINYVEMQFPFTGSDICPVKLYEVNEWKDANAEAANFLKKAISTNNNAVFLCVIEDNFKKNNSEIMDLISKAYKTRGKRNKWRFIFVSENPQIVKKILNSEFSIKNAEVYGMDDIVLISKRIEEYQNEFYMIQYLKLTSESIKINLNDVEKGITVEAENNKQSKDLDMLEQETLDLLEECKVQYIFTSDKSAEAIVDIFLDNLAYDFKKRLQALSNKKGIFVWEELKKIRDRFIDEMPGEIRKNMKYMSNRISCNLSCKMDKQLITNLGFIGCVDEINYLKEVSKEEILVYRPDIEKTLEAIKRYTIEVESGSTPEYPFNKRITRPFKNDLYYFDFYNGLKYLLYKKGSILFPFFADNSVNLNGVMDLVMGFKVEIKVIKPYLLSYLEKCIELTQEKSRNKEIEFNEKKIEIEKEIINRVNQLRKEAEISAVEKEKLAYIQTLCKRIENITLLEGGDTCGK